MARKQLIQLRRDTAANWTSANPILAVGEPGVETDTQKIKYGNGSAAWASLPYASTETAASIGLGNVDNTSDALKPVSTATQTALNNKAAKADMYVNVMDYGAVGNGTTDDTAAIQAAADYCYINKKVLYFPAKTYLITATIILRCSVEAIEAVVQINNTATIAVQLGISTNYTSRVKVNLPKIIQLGKSIGVPGWSGNDTGLKVYNLSESKVYIPYVKNFSYGVWVSASNGSGTAYSSFDFGYIHNCKVSLMLYPEEDGSWVNQNTFFGGRMEQAASTEGTNIPGCRQILIKNNPSAIVTAPNNNTFYSLSLEGDGPEYLIEANGDTNAFINCRYEATTPKIHWTNLSPYGVANKNMILGGYKSSDIVFTRDAGVASNTLLTNNAILTVDTIRLETGSIFSNASSSNAAIIASVIGTKINRNKGDANPALEVSQQHASSTGDILRLNNNTSTVLAVTQLGDMKLGDATDLVLGTVSGTKIGTSTTQKLSFYNSTPIVQPTGNVLTALGNLGLVGSPTLSSSDVGLGNVNNTADSAKPVSSAQQAALDLKEPTITIGTSAQYYRGDKTFQTLDTSVVPENGSLYYTDARADARIAADTLHVLKAGDTMTGSLITSGIFRTDQGICNNSSNANAYVRTLTTGTKIERNIAGAGAALTIDQVNAASTGAILDARFGGVTKFSVSIGGSVTLVDAANLVIGSTTGTKIGTATTQKLGLWNATPIVQPTTAIAGATVIAGAGTGINDVSTFDGYTISQVVKALRNIGILA